MIQPLFPCNCLLDSDIFFKISRVLAFLDLDLESTRSID